LRTALQIIPFYQNRLEVIREQLQREKEKQNPKTSDIEFLDTHFQTLAMQLETEKGQIQGLANEIYQTWKSIKQIRTEQMFNGSGIVLKVPVGSRDKDVSSFEEAKEVDFNFVY